ncbi:hypothetical protein NYE24_06905 [Paenibacillus sp. FSL H7-0350]|nr:hypothetical protein [Paenibacillus sp. FSL R7-269]
MSKLDGNERWKTKMLMTEHVEEYEQAERAATSDKDDIRIAIAAYRDKNI